jgi:PhnB protein
VTNVNPIPDGYPGVQPYLVTTNCAAAIDFYKKIFGAKERMRMARPDGSVGHAELEFGGFCVMMADENPQISAYAPEHYGGSPVSLHIYVENCDAVYKSALAAGAKTEREPADQFYGDRTAGIVDPFGYKWYIATHVKDVSMEDMRKAQ